MKLAPPRFSWYVCNVTSDSLASEAAPKTSGFAILRLSTGDFGKRTACQVHGRAARTQQASKGKRNEKSHKETDSAACGVRHDGRCSARLGGARQRRLQERRRECGRAGSGRRPGQRRSGGDNR